MLNMVFLNSFIKKESKHNAENAKKIYDTLNSYINPSSHFYFNGEKISLLYNINIKYILDKKLKSNDFVNEDNPLWQ